MKRIFFFSLIFLFLIQFGTIAWGMGLKLPELPEKAKIYFTEVDYFSLGDLPSPKTFPNLAEGGENQISSSCWSNDLYPKAIIMKNGAWDKVKGTWNGPVADVISKVTGKSNSNVFIWTGVHSFFDAWTDATAHSKGETHFFPGDDYWHIVKNCRDFSAVMITLNFSRRIFIEKIAAKEAAQDLICVGLIRVVVFNVTMKVVKGGFGAYNDPFYNQHTLPYWWFENGRFTDKYISTGRFTTPLLDGCAIMGFIFRKTWKF